MRKGITTHTLICTVPRCWVPSTVALLLLYYRYSPPTTTTTTTTDCLLLLDDIGLLLRDELQLGAGPRNRLGNAPRAGRPLRDRRGWLGLEL